MVRRVSSVQGRCAIVLAFFLPLLSGITVTRNEAIPEFPNEIQFYLSASSESQIESVEIEIGTSALTCGESLSRALPDEFTPGTSIEVEWMWNMRQRGILPPGTMIWWRWDIRDAAGNLLVTPEQNLRFSDETFNWREVDTPSLKLHWYDGTTDFARTLIDAGEESLEKLQQVTGVAMADQIQVYIYASSSEMQSATLFAPEWSGGLAFPDHLTVLIGIPPFQLEWGKRALAHELSHVLIGYYTFSCVTNMPTWLSEGLAMYVEGEMEPHYVGMISEAIETDSLLSVRELGEIFSSDPELARLAYAQSLSLVEFLIDEYGQAKMLELLDMVKEGVPEDRALMTAHGMDRDGLETVWREWIGAAPMESVPTAGPTPTRTAFPTLPPITGPAIVTATPQIVGSLMPTPSPRISTPTAPPESLEPSRRDNITLTLAVGVGALAIILLLIGRSIVRRKKAR